MGESVSSVVDAGDTHMPTCRRLCESKSVDEVKRPGIPTQAVDELACSRTLFICTGNTCRSPMAEVLPAQLLSVHCNLPVVEFCRGTDLSCNSRFSGDDGCGGENATPSRLSGPWADLSPHKSRMVTMCSRGRIIRCDDRKSLLDAREHCLEGMYASAMLSPVHEISDPIAPNSRRIAPAPIRCPDMSENAPA